MITDLSYPIGRYEPEEFSPELREQRLLEIEVLPKALEFAIINLDEHQLNTPYRPGGWTVHQVVHHVADSHMNAFARFKLGLTEERPTIKPYLQDKWVELEDVSKIPVNVSITLLYALHTRWVKLLESLTEAEWQREVIHPEHGKVMTLWYLFGNYAWHGKHHTAHINELRRREGW